MSSSSSDEQIEAQDITRLTSGGVNNGAEFKAGDIVGGTYEILEWIGAGGMGSVYRVRHKVMESEYALKTLSADKVTDVAWRRFQNEAQAIARMNHPNVVGIYNLGLHDDVQPYYVMDLLPGTALADILQKRGALPLEEAIELFAEVCAGMAYAHKKGIVHRDLKPANIIVTKAAERGGVRAKIVDFGIAKLSYTKDFANQKLTNAGEIFGSPYYMSPEQCEGGKVDARSDIYSLACALFEALTGYPPFKGNNALDTMLQHQTNRPPTLKDAAGGKVFPQKLEDLLTKALAKAPMDRYQNMESLARDLASVLGSDDIPTAQDRAIPVWVFAGAIVLILIPLAFAVLWFNGKNQHVNDNQDPISATTDGTPGKNATVNQPLDSQASLASYSRVITKSNGRRFRLFDFPKDSALGFFQIEGRKGSVICQGTVEVPDDDSVTFVPGGKGLEHPEYLDRFSADDLKNVRLISMPMDAKATNATLKHLSHITSIKSLVLLDCDIDDQGVPYLNKLTHLDSLNIDLTPISSRALACLTVLKNLNSLYLHTNDSVTPVLEVIKNSKKMEVLYLHDTILKPSDYNLIASLSNLTALQADGCDTHNKDLETISVLPKLQQINFGRDYIDVGAVTTLKKMMARSLRTAHLNSPSVKPHTCERIHDALPELHLE